MPIDSILDQVWAGVSRFFLCSKIVPGSVVSATYDAFCSRDAGFIDSMRICKRFFSSRDSPRQSQERSGLCKTHQLMLLVKVLFFVSERAVPPRYL